jgi:hypothetical protein
MGLIEALKSPSSEKVNNPRYINERNIKVILTGTFTTSFPPVGTYVYEDIELKKMVNGLTTIKYIKNIESV